MEQLISKQELNNLLTIKGEIRGLALKNLGDFILKEEAEQGLKKLEDAMEKIGQSVKYRDIKSVSFFPLALFEISLLLIQRLFNYDDKKFQEMGAFQVTTSIIIRFFGKYLLSLNILIKSVPRMWKEYFTVGNLRVVELNEEKRYMVVRLEDFHLTSHMSQVLIGYFPNILKIVVKSKTTCKQKSVTPDKHYYEFLLNW